MGNILHLSLNAMNYNVGQRIIMQQLQNIV